MTGSRIKNKCNKWPSRENFLALKQIQNKCKDLKRQLKIIFVKSAKNQHLNNKSFWNSIPLFLTNKNVRNDDVIILKDKGQLIDDKLEVAENLNSHYINIVKRTFGQPPVTVGNPMDRTNDIASVDAIISNYKNHSSINQIRK